MKRVLQALRRLLKRLVVLPFAVLAKIFFGLVSLVLSVLSIPAVRRWVWKKVKKRTKEKVIDIEGRVKQKVKRKLVDEE